MKKFLKSSILAGTAVLAVAGLASCGNSNEGNVSDDEKAKITIWATAKEEDVIKTVVDTYNKSHKNGFTYEFKAVAEGDAGTTLGADPTVKGAPALFLCADDHISSLQSKNIVAEIKGARKDKVVAEMTETAVAGATLDGKLYGYPVTNDNGYFLWYNSKELADVTTLEGILQTAESKGKSVLMDVPNGWYANSFIMSPQACGTKSLTWAKAENGVAYTTTWDNEVGVKVSSYISELLTPYYANGTLKIGGNDVLLDGMKNGTLIGGVSGTWMEADLKDAMKAVNGELAASKLPVYTIDGQQYQMASFSGAKVYCINKTRPVAEQKAAAELAELLTAKEGQLVRFEKRQSLPCNKEAAKDERYTKNVSIGGKALLDQSEFACVQAQTAEGRYWDFGKAIGQAYIDGILEDAEGNNITWAQFLKSKMDALRKAA